MSVTVLILILSLFHQNIITSSAALTTTSFFVQHAVPSGLATFHALCNFQSQVQQRALRARNYCTCRALRARNYPVPRPSATPRAPRTRKPSKSPRQAFPFQVFLPSATFNPSSAAFTTTSLLSNIPCPQGSQLFRSKNLCNFPAFTTTSLICTTCRALRARNFLCPLQISISSLAAFTTTSLLTNIPCPQGSQLSPSITDEDTLDT